MSAIPAPRELVWVTVKSGMTVPIEALTRLLAAAAADQFQTPPRAHTAIVLVRPGPVLEKSQWAGGVFPAPTIINAIDDVAFPGNDFYRIFIVNPGTPDQLPPAFDDTIDRIVFITDSLPAMPDPALTGYLKPGAVSPTDPNRTYFSSFIPTLLLGPPLEPLRDRPLPLGRLFLDICRDALGLVPEPIRQALNIAAERPGFRSELLDDGFRMTTRGLQAAPRNALDRDQCRLRIDPAEIAELWDEALRNPATIPAFHLSPSQSNRASANRWARAVTNRRIGVAASGGGATSYRLVPIIERLNLKKVPIDLVAGVSAGTSLGAYCARDERNGLTRYTNAGNALSILGVLFAGVTSQPIETGMDVAFQHTDPDDGKSYDTNVEDLEVRLVAVATALPPSGPPEPRVVVGGTLGAAVRASGALPIFFARTVKHGVVYTDGVMTAAIPARALADYGADYVVACNSIPGPNSRNPIKRFLGGEFVYRFTFAGPMIDMLVSNAFLVKRIYREASLFAHKFIQVKPNEATLTEIYRWDKAEQLADEVDRDPDTEMEAGDCEELWNAIRPDPT
jgi:predicted acylesterase/phospholipase RssA